jgi:hypothetical protein
MAIDRRVLVTGTVTGGFTMTGLMGDLRMIVAASTTVAGDLEETEARVRSTRESTMTYSYWYQKALIAG